jgi:hypothetical protein
MTSLSLLPIAWGKAGSDFKSVYPKSALLPVRVLTTQEILEGSLV